MLDTITYRTCACCEGDTATRIAEYSPDGWDVVSCDDCRFVYLRNPPEYEALQEDFAWEKTYEARRETRKGSTRLSPALRWFKTNVLYYGRDRGGKFRRWFNDGKVLDIGCGDGSRIIEPMTPYGIELSTALHAKADANMRARGGSCLHGAGAEAIWEFEPESFNGIIMHSYLEHEVAVMKVLKGAHRCLKPDGCVFIRVPNFGALNRRIIGRNWCGFRYPDHVNYFTLASLREVAARAGFDLELVNRATLPLDDNIQVLLRKVSGLRKD